MQKKAPAAKHQLNDPAKRHSPLREARKTFQQDGHWIEKPHKTDILVCSCGNRYIKTRRNQLQCLRCHSLAQSFQK